MIKYLMASFLFLASPVGAHAAPASHMPFKPLAFLAGSCWHGTLPDGKINTHCFRWLYDRKFLQDDHKVLGPDDLYEGKTIYAWDHKKSKLHYTYYSSLGGISTGLVLFPEKGEIHFPETYENEGVTRHFRSIWLQDSPNSYLTKMEEKKDTGWTPVWQVRFQRVIPQATKE